jgi:DeoR family transcriptional regulator, glycerol-3-phosphate regulon repressor
MASGEKILRETKELSLLRLNPRQRQIIEILRKDMNRSVSAPAEALAVSTETVRRDVRLLAAKGLLVKSHGAVQWPDRRDDQPLQRRLLDNLGGKERIAAALAREIADGESLLIDTGSTNIYVAEALRGHRGLTAITNSAPIAQRLSQGEGNRVFLAGGEVRADDNATFGSATLAFIRQFRVKTAIISAAAVGARLGIMDNHLAEAEVCRALIGQADRVILAADRTKFTATGLVVACAFEDIDLIVTDSQPPPEIAEALERADAQILVGAADSTS